MFKRIFSFGMMFVLVFLSTSFSSASPLTDLTQIDLEEIKIANEEYFQLVKSGQNNQFDKRKREKFLSLFEGKPQLEEQFIANIEAFKPSNVQIAVDEAAEHINDLEGIYFKQFKDGSFIVVEYELKKVKNGNKKEINPMSISYIPLGEYEVTWTLRLSHILYPDTRLILRTNMDVKESEIKVWDATALSNYQPPFVNVTQSASILDDRSTSSSDPARTKGEYKVTYAGSDGTGIYVQSYTLRTTIYHLGYDPRPAYNGVKTEIEHTYQEN